MVVVAALMLSAARAIGDDSYPGQPLVQVRFDQLIPMSYPTKSVRFDRLRETTWPLIDPGIANIPITENLIRPLDQPLLIVNEATVGRLPRVRPKQQSQQSVPVPRPKSEARPPRAGGKGR